MEKSKGAESEITKQGQTFQQFLPLNFFDLFINFLFLWESTSKILYSFGFFFGLRPGAMILVNFHVCCKG